MYISMVSFHRKFDTFKLRYNRVTKFDNDVFTLSNKKALQSSDDCKAFIYPAWVVAMLGAAGCKFSSNSNFARMR
jgi:hypothetical protein